MMYNNLFLSSIYDSMFDNEEMWYVTANGNAMLISDASLTDC